MNTMRNTNVPVGIVITIMLIILGIALVTPVWIFAPIGVAITTTILVAIGLIFYIRSLASQSSNKP